MHLTHVVETSPLGPCAARRTRALRTSQSRRLSADQDGPVSGRQQSGYRSAKWANFNIINMHAGSFEYSNVTRTNAAHAYMRTVKVR